jgi:hypothetical protein
MIVLAGTPAAIVNVAPPAVPVQSFKVDGPTNLAEKVERRGAELSRHQRAVMITGHR